MKKTFALLPPLGNSCNLRVATRDQDGVKDGKRSQLYRAGELSAWSGDDTHGTRCGS